MSKRRYSEFKNDIDVDSFEAAIGFDPVERRGHNDIGHCPDVWGLHKHGDTTGKFAIHREERLYNCWVCGGGNFLSLTMEMFDMNVEEATEWLRQFTMGDVRSDAEFIDHFMELLEDTERRVTTLPFFNDRVLEKFADDVDWFYSRGLNDEIIAEYNLRFSNLAMKPAPIKMRGGIPEKIDDDYYGPTAIFPHYWRGRLVGWQHRWMNWDYEHTQTPKWLAKYTNTTDFPKSDTVFNYDKAESSTEPVVVVESVVTVLLLTRYGIPAISYFGGGITEPQLRLIRKLQQGVLLAPDNDDVGKKFVNTATKYLEDYIDVKILPPVEGKPGSDLGDYVNEEYHKGDGAYRALRSHLSQAHSPEVL